MTSSAMFSAPGSAAPPNPSVRIDYLDATRAFALILGIVFHASLSFMPVFMGWAVQDVSTSPVVAGFVTVSHSFRMEIFFLLSGFFAQGAFHRQGTARFVGARAVRIVVPFVLGWFLLRPLIVSGWIMGAASLREDYDFLAALREGFRSLQTLPAGIFTGSHLWFLYYLALITALTLVIRGLLVKSGLAAGSFARAADSLIRWVARSGLALPALAVPTAVTLWFMDLWGMDTPDRSLQPHVPVLIVYSGFFVLGWMFSRQPEAISTFSRLSASRWVFALLGIIGTLLLSPLQMDPGHPHRTAAQVVFSISYALMMWSLVAVTLGVLRTVCRQARSWIRYLADSAYWLYLSHLPIVVWLQVAVAEVALHWSLKLALVSATTLAVTLLTYDLLVRPTAIGWVLNGRRRKSALLALVRPRAAPLTPST